MRWHITSPPRGEVNPKRVNLPWVTETLTDLVTVCSPHFVPDPVDSGQSIVNGQSREARSDLGTSPAIHAQNVIERGVDGGTSDFKLGTLAALRPGHSRPRTTASSQSRGLERQHSTGHPLLIVTSL